MRIGVLALQGAFREHIDQLARLSVDAVEVRLPKHLAGVDALVIPGGESTTIRKLMTDYKLIGPIGSAIKGGLPVLGTCAGMIVCAKRVDGEEVPGIGGLDVELRRNAFGRQVDSFEADVDVPILGTQPFHGVFIRAPVVESVQPEVKILAQLKDGRIVAVRQGAVVGIAFHPELTDDDRFHRYFLKLVKEAHPVTSAAW
ncbi:MAG: pyridoxal 5'-phosphate synthase glutaminase subunit PdxT [Chloroflexi bacterium]|nr:pyridoxal 5'-phosphate synthase glutaminase subunit PdxT [Chloroflexota bacterium]